MRCDLYPNKNRTELIGDLLASALDAVSDAFPYQEGPKFNTPDGPTHEILGPRADFPRLTSKYIRELEAELSANAQALSAQASKRTVEGRSKPSTGRGKSRCWTLSTK